MGRQLTGQGLDVLELVRALVGLEDDGALGVTVGKGELERLALLRVERGVGELGLGGGNGGQGQGGERVLHFEIGYFLKVGSTIGNEELAFRAWWTLRK